MVLLVLLQAEHEQGRAVRALAFILILSLSKDWEGLSKLRRPGGADRLRRGRAFLG